MTSTITVDVDVDVEVDVDVGVDVDVDIDVDVDVDVRTTSTSRSFISCPSWLVYSTTHTPTNANASIATSHASCTALRKIYICPLCRMGIANRTGPVRSVISDGSGIDLSPYLSDTDLNFWAPMSSVRFGITSENFDKTVKKLTNLAKILKHFADKFTKTFVTP